MRNMSTSHPFFAKNRLQNDSELTVVGEKEWGRNLKMILKYLVLRYGMG